MLRVAAEVLRDVMFKRPFVDQQVEALRIARPDLLHLAVDDMACEIIWSELRKRKQAVCQA